MVFFTFIRTLHMFKILLSIVSLLFYFLIIFGLVGHTDNEFLNTRTFFSVRIITLRTSINFPCQSESFGYEIWTTDREQRYLSHFAFLMGLFFYFLILDRQNEYIHLLDYTWKKQLKDDQFKARSTKLVNKILLQNILPQHVADWYLSK